MAFHDVPHCLATAAIAPMAQGAPKAILPPRAMPADHAHHEIFQLLVDAGTANQLTPRRTDIVLVHTLAVPGEDRVGLGKRRDLFPGLRAELLAPLGQGLALCLGEVSPPPELLAEEAVFRCEVGMAPPELCVNSLSD